MALFINDPSYQHGGSITLDTPVISGVDASSFSIDTNSGDYAGSPTFCNNAQRLRTERVVKLLSPHTRQSNINTSNRYVDY